MSAVISVRRMRVVRAKKVRGFQAALKRTYQAQYKLDNTRGRVPYALGVTVCLVCGRLQNTV